MSTISKQRLLRFVLSRERAARNRLNVATELVARYYELGAAHAYSDVTAGTARAAGQRSYDTTQREAVLVTWICCRSTVYATETKNGCWRCREAA
jgi:hypothetical protein